MRVRVHVYVSGRVQGVFFRFETRCLARCLGVTGWITNLRNGKVEAVFEGVKEDVEKMITFCKKGPLGATVTTIDVKWEEYTRGFKGFKVHYGFLDEEMNL